MALSKNLIGWWRFDETSGATAIDSCSRFGATAHNGTLVNSPVRTAGKIGGRAILLNGIDQTVTAGSVSELEFGNTDSFTFSGWVKPSTLTEDGYIYSNASLGSGFGFYWQGSTDRIVLTNGSGVTGFTSDAVFTDVDWVHISVSYNGSIATYYRNGVKSGEATGYTTVAGSNSVLFGNRTGGASAATYFAGAVDDFRIYNRVLQRSEIVEIYQNGLLYL